MIEITDIPIDANKILGRLGKDSSGSIVLHYAVVKGMEGGKKTVSLEFKVDGNLEEEMRILERELREKWPVEDVLLVRRIGSLSVGDIISVAAASAEHRTAAFGLCQEAVNRFKKMLCVLKREVQEGD